MILECILDSLLHHNTYTLLDGLAYNTRGYFANWRSIFPSPAGARKNASNEQNVREYYMLNHLIRGLSLKGVILIQFYLVGVFFKKCIICPSGRLRTM